MLTGFLSISRARLRHSANTSSSIILWAMTTPMGTTISSSRNPTTGTRRGWGRSGKDVVNAEDGEDLRVPGRARVAVGEIQRVSLSLDRPRLLFPRRSHLSESLPSARAARASSTLGGLPACRSEIVFNWFVSHGAGATYFILPLFPRL